MAYNKSDTLSLKLLTTVTTLFTLQVNARDGVDSPGKIASIFTNHHPSEAINLSKQRT